MNYFQEIRDFELLTPAKFESTINSNPNSNYAYVIVKSSVDYIDNNTFNKSYYFVIKSNKRKFIKQCLEYAMSSLIPSVTSYQVEVHVKEV